MPMTTRTKSRKPTGGHAMPNFTDKARRLERLRLPLRRRYGEPEHVAVTHPVEHLLRTILSEEATTAQTDEAVARLRRHFVDFNDLRVSRPREIRDVLGANFPRSSHKARVIPRILDQVFKQFNSMVWDFLHEMGKVQSRAYFEKLEDVRPFVAATIARDCIGAHAFPVDNDVARVLGRLGIVDPAVQSEAEMQAFLERAVKASRAYETHGLIKRLAEDLCIVGTPKCADCPLNAMCPSAVCPPRGKAKRKAGAAKAGLSKAAKPKKARAAAGKRK
jgi:endonuclease III